jgi:hypothetical protein
MVSATAARNDLAGTVAFYADDTVLPPLNAPIANDQKSIRRRNKGRAAVVVERRLVCAAAAGACESRLELGLRKRHDP